jgi:hypothetical protein
LNKDSVRASANVSMGVSVSFVSAAAVVNSKKIYVDEAGTETHIEDNMTINPRQYARVRE